MKIDKPHGVLMGHSRLSPVDPIATLGVRGLY